MADGLTEMQRAFLSASELREATEDLSAADINRMSMRDYARIRRRAGLDPIDPFESVYRDEPPGRPREAAPTAPEPPAPDYGAMGLNEYGRVRDQLGIGRSASARGLFDGHPATNHR